MVDDPHNVHLHYVGTNTRAELAPFRWMGVDGQQNGAMTISDEN